MRDYKSNRELVALDSVAINAMSAMEFKTLEARVRRAIKAQGLKLKKIEKPAASVGNELITTPYYYLIEQDNLIVAETDDFLCVLKWAYEPEFTKEENETFAMLHNSIKDLDKLEKEAAELGINLDDTLS